MNNLLLEKEIDIEYEWSKTLLAKLGKKKPSRVWIIQLVRIYNRKYNTKRYKYNRETNKIVKFRSIYEIYE